jgi:hypothetical protein
LDITGLDNFELPRPMALQTIPLTQATPFVTGSGPVGLFIGKDFRRLALRSHAHRRWQVVGLLEFDGFYARCSSEFQAGRAAVRTDANGALDGVSGPERRT